MSGRSTLDSRTSRHATHGFLVDLCYTCLLCLLYSHLPRVDSSGISPGTKYTHSLACRTTQNRWVSGSPPASLSPASSSSTTHTSAANLPFHRGIGSSTP